MNKNSTLALVLIINIITLSLTAQNVGINDDNSLPDSKAILDIKSSNKGVLLPRIALTGRNDNTTISSPTTSMIIYNTATAGTGNNSVAPGFYYYNGTQWTPDLGGTTLNHHYVGELYGGGVVFWVDHTGQHGLICSMVTLSHQWSNTSVTIGNSARSDWNGQTNSAAIIGQSGHIDSAAKRCDDYLNIDYGTGIFNDWYLPSIGELNHVWNNFFEVQKALASDGNNNTDPLVKTDYWTSSESEVGQAYVFKFNNGEINLRNKSEFLFIRPIRAF